MANTENYQRTIQKVVDNVEKVIVGKRNAIYLSLVALLSDGHMLLQDVPGVGKTMLVRSIAKSVGGSYKRIQFTPDLLPSDVLGVSIYNQKTNEFEFKSGPIMANVVLADEINRTSPKTQSALLEAMEESMITIDGISYRLPEPFFVMATQNPIEYEGTFPLPEAQLDRFMLKIRLGYPDKEDEVKILERLQSGHHPIDDLEQVTTLEQLLVLQGEARKIFVEESLRRYIVEIVNASREHEKVYLGASPRAAISLLRASQSLALLRGRDFVVPDDIKYLVEPVLGHRIILKSDARLHGFTIEKVLTEIIKKVKVPVS